jgi:hypothetical protein
MIDVVIHFFLLDAPDLSFCPLFLPFHAKSSVHIFFPPTFFPQVGEAFAKSSVHDKAGAKKFIVKYVKKKKIAHPLSVM